jgi:hypothetical protein
LAPRLQEKCVDEIAEMVEWRRSQRKATLTVCEMRLIFKALLVLACLVPTLPAAGADSESRFIRVQRNESREPVALQTAIAKYVPASSQQGVQIDLIAVVHIGEQAYYRRLNREFEKYDAVLYELVAPESTRPTRGAERSDNPLAMLQQVMKLVLSVEHQLEVIDYHKPNLIHADLSLDGLRKAMKDRGEDEMTVILKVFAELMQKMREGVDRPGSQAPDINLLEMLLNPAKLKRIFAEQLVEAGGDAGFGRTFNQLVVIDRNKACLEVLKQQLKAGKKKIAIFYGAAHMPDFDKRLTEELGVKRTTNEWIDAWSLK